MLLSIDDGEQVLTRTASLNLGNGNLTICIGTPGFVVSGIAVLGIVIHAYRRIWDNPLYAGPGLSESATLPTWINFDPKHIIRQTRLSPSLA